MDRKVPDNFHALYDRGFRAARGAHCLHRPHSWRQPVTNA
jgi:hypothetical protein